MTAKPSMTESEWAVCQEPPKMLEALRASGKASFRKVRLFSVACCRRVWPWLTDTRSRQAVEVAERFAELDGLNPDPVKRMRLMPEVRKAWEAAGANWQLVVGEPFRWATEFSEWAIPKATQPAQERQAQAALLRDIFGPLPFRDVVLDPVWLTATVHSLAIASYQERQLPSGTLDQLRLGVLADALEDAGAAGEIVAHLRGPGPHVRGCFAVDLILGKE